MTRMLGAKFKVVSGYPSSGEIDLAIERGELEGRCGVSYGSLRTTRPDWLEKKQVEVLIQLGLSKQRLELMPTTGAEMEVLFTKLHSLPQPVLNRARALAHTQE